MSEPGQREKRAGLAPWMPTFIACNGLGMAWWEVTKDHLDRPYLLILVGALCSGAPAQVIVAVMDWIGGRRNGA